VALHARPGPKGLSGIADTGFGNALGVRPTVRTAQRAGAECNPLDVQAAVDTRPAPDLPTIARTDAAASPRLHSRGRAGAGSPGRRRRGRVPDAHRAPGRRWAGMSHVRRPFDDLTPAR
jgi:hypothetical protein